MKFPKSSLVWKARHWAKWFADIFKLNSANNPMRQEISSPLVTLKVIFEGKVWVMKNWDECFCTSESDSDRKDYYVVMLLLVLILPLLEM